MMSHDSYHEFEDLDDWFDDCTASVDDMFLASIAANSNPVNALVREAVGFANWGRRVGRSVRQFIVDLRVPNCASEPVPRSGGRWQSGVDQCGIGCVRGPPGSRSSAIRA